MSQRKPPLANAAPSVRRRRSAAHAPSARRDAGQAHVRPARFTLPHFTLPRSLPWRPILGVLLGLLTLVLGVRGLILAHEAATAASLGESGSSSAAPAVGHLAPDAVFLDLSNHQVRLSSYRGKVVVLNFWYVACPPCKTEMPALERAYQSHSARGLVVLGVDVSDDAATITGFIQQLDITYPIVRDQDARATIRYGLYATPSSFIIDRHGIIRYKVEGPLDLSTLNADLNGVLGKS
jgi:cytochrome c biogenesis protein CcmG, thiol:disulfide interchange protein DsbE